MTALGWGWRRRKCIHSRLFLAFSRKVNFLFKNKLEEANRLPEPKKLLGKPSLGKIQIEYPSHLLAAELEV